MIIIIIKSKTMIIIITKSKTMIIINADRAGILVVYLDVDVGNFKREHAIYLASSLLMYSGNNKG
jgi:hypothetical protein